ncbi:hypothetical protein DL96DRAFT_1614313 [Flagelloscypha sp. PMI_526]|nr:hypothetical protein DL96DRAFT_1614313 [Flagelloscypha sp. PMI_526]
MSAYNFLPYESSFSLDLFAGLPSSPSMPELASMLQVNSGIDEGLDRGNMEQGWDLQYIDDYSSQPMFPGNIDKVNETNWPVVSLEDTAFHSCVPEAFTILEDLPSPKFYDSGCDPFSEGPFPLALLLPAYFDADCAGTLSHPRVLSSRRRRSTGLVPSPLKQTVHSEERRNIFDSGNQELVKSEIIFGELDSLFTHFGSFGSQAGQRVDPALLDYIMNSPVEQDWPDVHTETLPTDTF